MKQCTLKSAFTIKGKGLHTGREIEATFKPAPDNFGRKFLRIDVEGAAPIEAVAENVVETCRGTVIASGDLKISTIEHAMAALYASNVDNCLVELNGPEVPILDGSAKIFMDKIEEVGVVEQTEDAAVYVVRNRTTVKDSETEASICVIPDSDFCVDVMIEFNSVVLSNQFATLDSLDDFKTQIAASRTFVFVREIEELVKHDLIKGGDLDNAIVIYDTPVAQSELDRIADMMNVPRKKVSEFGFINSDELVFKNEPARHKLLDVVGDVALIGRRVQGRIIATCPGHTINTTFAKKVRRELKRQEVQAPVYNPNETPIMDVNRIRELLPHRYPFLPLRHRTARMRLYARRRGVAHPASECRNRTDSVVCRYSSACCSVQYDVGEENSQVVRPRFDHRAASDCGSSCGIYSAHCRRRFADSLAPNSHKRICYWCSISRFS